MAAFSPDSLRSLVAAYPTPSPWAIVIIAPRSAERATGSGTSRRTDVVVHDSSTMLIVPSVDDGARRRKRLSIWCMSHDGFIGKMIPGPASILPGEPKDPLACNALTTACATGLRVLPRVDADPHRPGQCAVHADLDQPGRGAELSLAVRRRGQDGVAIGGRSAGHRPDQPAARGGRLRLRSGDPRVGAGGRHPGVFHPRESDPDPPHPSSRRRPASPRTRAR